MLIVFNGNLGSGKTLAMTRELFHYIKNGYHCYTNYQLYKLPYKKLDNPNQIINIPTNRKTVIGIDEAYLWFDSYNGKIDVKTLLRNIINVSRKKNFIIYMTTQTINQLFVRTREAIHIIGRPHIVKQNEILKITWMTKDENGYRILETNHFSNIKQWYKYFDTNEILQDFHNVGCDRGLTDFGVSF